MTGQIDLEVGRAHGSDKQPLTASELWLRVDTSLHHVHALAEGVVENVEGVGGSRLPVLVGVHLQGEGAVLQADVALGGGSSQAEDAKVVAFCLDDALYGLPLRPLDGFLSLACHARLLLPPRPDGLQKINIQRVIARNCTIDVHIFCACA
eukprot:CAMPEP_0177784188 /NCGR_PEP_ID=MMETSP0491_2-20121128/19547_1 /TAXON_ID=63592 /ORGANISM="Tetraselmis chuii, Strain PLY429" /LENGTH=150 /DNA_ID=CAMNT_0019304897 /DNA_START=36 /DNA_END=486 /DNA_ORIENTATION=-